MKSTGISPTEVVVALVALGLFSSHVCLAADVRETDADAQASRHALLSKQYSNENNDYVKCNAFGDTVRAALDWRLEKERGHIGTVPAPEDLAEAAFSVNRRLYRFVVLSIRQAYEHPEPIQDALDNHELGLKNGSWVVRCTDYLAAYQD